MIKQKRMSAWFEEQINHLLPYHTQTPSMINFWIWRQILTRDTFLLLVFYLQKPLFRILSTWNFKGRLDLVMCMRECYEIFDCPFRRSQYESLPGNMDSGTLSFAGKSRRGFHPWLRTSKWQGPWKTLLRTDPEQRLHRCFSQYHSNRIS